MKWKKMIATVMAVSLAISVTPVSQAAASTENTPKEEVVYVNLGGDGSVEKINVVNIFELEQDGTIVDYGEYESLRNMNTTDEIQVSEDRITIDAKAGKLYYEGELDGKVMPWNIVIRYYIDGEELKSYEYVSEIRDAGIAAEPVKLGADEYFLLGDNPQGGEDSRSSDIGIVKKDDLYGKVWFNTTSGDHFGIVKK